MEQHYNKEFGKFLKQHYRVERVSGDSQLKISFSAIVAKNDIIICTAQILENAFKEAKNDDEDEGVRLSGERHNFKRDEYLEYTQSCTFLN